MEQYSRHISLIGENGQRKLPEGKVAVIGSICGVIEAMKILTWLVNLLRASVCS